MQLGLDVWLRNSLIGSSGLIENSLSDTGDGNVGCGVGNNLGSRLFLGAFGLGITILVFCLADTLLGLGRSLVCIVVVIEIVGRKFAVIVGGGDSSCLGLGLAPTLLLCRGDGSTITVDLIIGLCNRVAWTPITALGRSSAGNQLAFDAVENDAGGIGVLEASHLSKLSIVDLKQMSVWSVSR